MRGSIHAWRSIRLSRARLLPVAAFVSGVLVSGCGGSSTSATGAKGAATTTLASTATRGGAATTSGSTAVSGVGSGPLAFAKCMRANGVPNFPDPSAGGGARFPIPTGSNPAAPAFRAAQAKCQKLMGGAVGGPLSLGATTHPSAQTVAKLVKIAQCMREHGVPQFPDPRTTVPSNPTGIQEITNFDGVILLFPATINLQAPAYKQALTACGAPPLGLPH
jgi:hypothetical protein